MSFARKPGLRQIRRCSNSILFAACRENIPRRLLARSAIGCRTGCGSRSGGCKMAMELYVFSDRQLSSMSAWQQVINAAGFPVGLPTRFPFDWENRVLPAEFRGRATTFESKLCDANEAMTESPDIDFGHPWKYGLVLRWGSDTYAGAAAY